MSVDPETGQVVLAAGAMAVAAGERPPLGVMTVRALDVEFSCGRCLTAQDRHEGFTLLRQEGFTESRHEGAVILVDKRGQIHVIAP